MTPKDLENLALVEKVAGQIMTVERLNQGFDFLKEQGLPELAKSTGAYLGHVVSDALSEEKLLIEESGLAPKDLGRSCSKIAKEYYFGVINTI